VHDLAGLQRLLRERTGFETVDISSTEGQIRLIGRVPPNASSQWILIVHRMLVTCESASWKADISRTYFLRQVTSGKKLFYAWRVILQAPKILECLPEIFNAVQTAPRPSRVELQEFPLAGASIHRNEPQNGKGAGSVDHVPLGPMAAASAMAARMGGSR